MILRVVVLTLVAVPFALLAALGIPVLLGRPFGERWVGRLTRGAMFLSISAALAALAIHVTQSSGPQLISFGRWFSAAGHGFSFDFLVDVPALAFALLASAISGVVAAFSYRYLHLEPGYTRYFALFSVFVAGLTLIAIAGSIEVLFAGWELLGLSSALLVAFFQERPASLRNAFRVFAVYRISDAAMLAAAVLLHHWAGSGSLQLLFGGEAVAVTPARATAIAILLIVAVAGKSALLPFSGWLPRAMEGPTPSSAVYYGALSIHAGCYLLLRAEPLLAQSLAARTLAIAAGLSTAIYATLTARVQTDVKSALAFASLTQVSIIVVEIGFGLTTLALVHMLGHACYRLLQFLSAPNILHDLHELESGLGEHRTSSRSVRSWLYLWALERGFVDALLERGLVAPFSAVVRRLDRLDRKLCGEEEP
jgi:NAD(P)H-quinone oxidoreductase subunit 5